MGKKAVFVAAGVFALAAAGCSSSHKSAGPTTSSTSAPVTAAPGTTIPPVTSTPSTTAPASTTTVASGPQPCPTSALTAALGSPNGAAGTVYYNLTLTNKGTATCTLYGYPGVSFVTGASGTQVGAAATRTPGTAAKLTLSPGQSAASPLGIVEAGNYGSRCQITPVDGLRVYPPGQTAALFVPHTAQGCANSSAQVLEVGPLAMPAG